MHLFSLCLKNFRCPQFWKDCTFCEVPHRANETCPKKMAAKLCPRCDIIHKNGKNSCPKLYCKRCDVYHVKTDGKCPKQVSKTTVDSTIDNTLENDTENAEKSSSDVENTAKPKVEEEIDIRLEKKMSTMDLLKMKVVCSDCGQADCATLANVAGGAQSLSRCPKVWRLCKYCDPGTYHRLGIPCPKRWCSSCGKEHRVQDATSGE